MAAEHPKKKSYSPAKTVKKAFALLEIVAERQPVRASDIAERLGLSRSNVHRLLSTLAELGYIEAGHDSAFRLGVKAFILGSNFTTPNNLSDLAYPQMKHLAEMSQENVNLGVTYENKVLYLNKIKSSHYLKLDTPMGRMDPLYCTGLGKVLLSGLTEADLDNYLAETSLVPHTRKTITDRWSLIVHIEEIRRQGIAVDQEEFDEGVHCIAAPILDHRMRIVAAMSLSAPAVRLTAEKISELKPHLLEACRSVSKKLGATGERRNDDRKSP
ncbi:MAG: IclR family transcriptional regulator [Desulfobacteraceae bacterium]|nr:MAG: IclR family transcriptional regulator [Desulfobacteraceae bacterium]